MGSLHNAAASTASMLRKLFAAFVFAALAAAGAAFASGATTFYGTTESGQTFNRPNADLHSLSGQVTLYSAQPFFVDKNATCSIYGTQEGSFDGMIFVYRAGFDPSNPLTNLIAGADNGDQGAGSSTLHGLSLTTSQDYTLVTTGGSAASKGTFTNTISCTGADHVLAGNGTLPAYNGTVAELQNGRFQISGTWRDFHGNTGSATFVPMGSTDSGIVWFFAPTNFELMLKVLNACANNNRYWIFLSALTNVEFHITVVDTWRSVTKHYDNALGSTAGSVLDTDALATCP